MLSKINRNMTIQQYLGTLPGNIAQKVVLPISSIDKPHDFIPFENQSQLAVLLRGHMHTQS